MHRLGFLCFILVLLITPLGVIAQEVQKVLPEIVVERKNGYLGVDYKRLVTLLIE